MDKRQTISLQQLGVLFFAFMTGSSIINIPGPLIAKAKNGAWLSLILAGGVGFMMLACILFLHRKYPKLTFVQYSRTLIGTWPTVILSVLTISFLIHMQTGIVVDISLFMVSSMLRETPMYVFSILIFMMSALTARAGLEVMARMFTLLTLVSAVFITVVLVLAIPDYKPILLLPILPEGLLPVLHGAVFATGFPYLELFLFAMIIPYTAAKAPAQVSRTLYWSLLFNIFILSVSCICSIMTLGEFAGDKPYVLFAVARLVEFQEIIQRIESVIGMSLIVGSFMKLTVTLYVLSLYMTQLLQLDDYRKFVMPLAVLGFMNTLVGFDGATEWAQIISLMHPVWGAASYIVPLLIVTVVALVRGKKSPV